MRSAFVLVVATLLVACASQREGADAPTPTSTVRFETDEGPRALRVALARTEAERVEGLQGVRELPAGEGMAFVYEEPTTSTFWMKDTLIPLSIAFVDQDGSVIAIRNMQPCAAEPCPRYGADAPYVLAIETNLGWFDRMGVEVGSRAELGGGLDG